MINMKGKISDELEKMVAEQNIVADVSDSFPDDWTKETQIQYTEEQNRAYEISGNKCVSSYVRFRIDIWNTKNTSSLAGWVDEKMNGVLGLKRTDCIDNNEPTRKHKIMRYEGIVYEATGRVCSPN